ncbi:MAG TPA: biopolymer transporter ExbD [Kofleriaceae bacterium]|nr:biopolymer transporter ExbD [Kofleriaceae bacterium]
MPVHPASSRLFSSIPFKHIAKERRGGAGGRDVNTPINVTPFVDMMTILVTFLLMVFSARGQLITAQRGLTLPDGLNDKELRRAPVIIITHDSITFQGEHMASVRSIEDDTSSEWKILKLYDRLKAEKRLFTLNFSDLPDEEKQYCANEAAGRISTNPLKTCLDGLLVLQADKDTDAKILNRVLATAKAAEYPKILFAINHRGK